MPNESMHCPLTVSYRPVPWQVHCTMYNEYMLECQHLLSKTSARINIYLYIHVHVIICIICMCTLHACMHPLAVACTCTCVWVKIFDSKYNVRGGFCSLLLLWDASD